MYNACAMLPICVEDSWKPGPGSLLTTYVTYVTYTSTYVTYTYYCVSVYVEKYASL